MFDAGTAEGVDAPTSGEALAQIASDLDSAATFIADASERRRLSELLQDAMDLADRMNLPLVAGHISMAADTLSPA